MGTLLPDEMAMAVADFRPADVEVVLADGRRLNLGGLKLDELLGLQWQEEQAFAREILAAPKGSSLRAEITARAYETVTQIYMAQRGASGNRLMLGIHPRHQRLVLELLARQCKQGLEPRFFEIGHGSGILLRRVLDAGYPIAGIEVSATLHAEARQLVGFPYAEYLCLGEFLKQEPPRADRRYTLVSWNDVFEHIPPDEIRDYLRRIHELLVPGGQLVTVTPNWHLRPWDITRVFHPPRTEAAGLHLKEYTLREVSRLLWECGFQRVATPLVVTPRRLVLCSDGLAGLKRLFEPSLEWLPFGLTRLLARGFGLSTTVATKR